MYTFYHIYYLTGNFIITDMDLTESLMDFKNHTFIIEIKGLIFQWWILLLVLLVIIGVLGRNETALAQY